MGDLLEAYGGVVSSSTDIIKNKQRHLYLNMFDLLTTTTRAASATSNITISDDICKFWYADILPICFDEDIGIQNSAIDSLDIFVKTIDSIQFHNSPKWPELKQQIINNYIDKLNKMRDQSNCNWYKIWSLLIRILNQEIVRSASIINTFLSVVEQGFRSPNYDIRAEAFICWKVLVEIFAQNNELISPKRIKLISIPLRSSHAKTVTAAINKFKVWWYFLLQLNDNIYNNCEMTFESFLQFCFGIPIYKNSITNNTSTGSGQLKQFNDAKEMSVIALIEMLGASHKEINLLLEKYELEHTEETLITESIMQKSYKYILKGCYEGTLIIVEQFTNRIKIIELLWRNLISQIIQTKSSIIYKECCIIIKELIRHDYDNPNSNLKSTIIQICQIFGTHYAFLMTTYNNRESTFDLNQIAETIIDFTDLLLSSGNLYFNIDNYKPIIKNIYDIDEYKESTKYWDMVKKLIENILNTDEIDNFSNFEIKLDIWKKLSIPIITYLDIKLFEFRIIKKADLINDWLLWPLNKIVLTKLSLNCIKNDLKYFDDEFINIWKKLMISSSQAEGRSIFQAAILEKFVIFTDKRERIPKFHEILSCYINNWDKKFDLASAPTEQLELIKNFLMKPPQKNENYNKIIENLSEYFSSLNELKLVVIFDQILPLSKQILLSEKLKYITKPCFDNYKKNLIEKLKNDKIDKKYLREFRNILKNADIFTVIPKIWTLNPDKLTEHQVEKMKEKNCDIPALYNDISSHSQDTIKPWTPSKIVISKNKDTEEIVIPGHSEIIINSPRQQHKQKSFTSIISDEYDFTEPKPVESIIKAYCQISDTNDSSSTTNTTTTTLSIPRIIEKYNTDNGKNKKMPKKKLNSSTMKKFTKQDEALLKKMNIHIDDEKKKLSILRNLKSISIDTVDGNTFYKSGRKSSLDENETGILTRRQEKDKNKNIKKSVTNINKSIKRITRKSLNFSNINQEESFNSDINEQSNKINLSLNSDDGDFVGSSQISESLISRRGRKSTSSITSKTTIVTEPTDYKNDSVDSVIDIIKTAQMAKIPNMKIRPLILSNELIKLSEMDTQLNTENLIQNDLNTTSTKQHSSSTIISLEDKNQHKLNKITSEQLSVSNSIFSNNVAHELFIGKSKGLNSSDNQIKQSPQSESVKELKNVLNANKTPKKVENKTTMIILPNQEEKEDGQNHQQNNDEYSSDSSPNNNKKIKKDQQKTPSPPPTILRKSEIEQPDIKKISELDTQPNTEQLLNNSLCKNDDKEITNEIEMPGTPQHRKINMEIIQESIIKSPAYSPIKPININARLLRKENNNSVTYSPECDFDMVIVEQNIEFLNDTPIKLINNSLKLLDSGNNNSIVTSPGYDNVEKKNEEFLNDTLNISPIELTLNKENNAEKDTSVEDMEIGEDFVKTKDLTDIIERQHSSPVRKKIKTPSGLSSPPDRKSTSNSSSPGPKPKQITPNLTGRGAQFINMIRNRNVNSQRNRISNTFMSAKNDDNKNTDFELVNTGLQQQQQNQLQPQKNNIQSSPPQENDNGIVVFMGSSVPPPPVTPQQLPRDLLVFSKVLPSPYASPSASILKRKCCNDTIDDFESPAMKRKRVSFHDPPVSVTKEYVKNDDEDGTKFSVRMALNKFLQSSTPQTSQQNINSNQQHQQQQHQFQNSNKHALKRKSRADSMMEILRFNESPMQNQQKKISLSKSLITTTTVPIITTPQKLPEISEINHYEKSKEEDTTSNIEEKSLNEMDSLKWNSTNNETSIIKTKLILPPPTNKIIDKTLSSSSTISSVLQLQDDDDDDDDESSLTPSPQIYFPNEIAIFKHIFDKYTIDDIVDKYCENGYDINNKNVRNIIKQISINMEKDNKIKTNVLEMLSEKHPKEFLDHAIQENLSSVVCDRLNSTSVIDFVFEKSKINNGVRKIVFEKMENIISMERFTRDRHDFFMTMLRNEQFTNDEILECIEIISAKRTRNMSGRGDGGAVVSTSDSVDSSSTF